MHPFPPLPPFQPFDKWHDLYQSAMLELDDKKLSLRISEARHVIMDRVEEVLTVSSTDERRDLSDALNALNMLEKVAGRYAA
jgi:hypothetical protein